MDDTPAGLWTLWRRVLGSHERRRLAAWLGLRALATALTIGTVGFLVWIAGAREASGLGVLGMVAMFATSYGAPPLLEAATRRAAAAFTVGVRDRCEDWAGRTAVHASLERHLDKTFSAALRTTHEMSYGVRTLVDAAATLVQAALFGVAAIGAGALFAPAAVAWVTGGAGFLATVAMIAAARARSRALAAPMEALARREQDVYVLLAEMVERLHTAELSGERAREMLLRRLAVLRRERTRLTRAIDDAQLRASVRSSAIRAGVLALAVTCIAVDALTVTNVTIGGMALFAVGHQLATADDAAEQLIPALARLGAFARLDGERTAYSLPTCCRRDGRPRAVHISRMTFRYVPGGPDIGAIDVAVQPGQTLAIFGPNGSGKTTLGLIVQGQLAPEAGEVLHDASPVGPRPCDGMTVVPQHPARWPLSVREFVTLGAPATDDEIWSALDEVGAAAFVHDFPHGLDTTPSDLSGGQWQLLAIARARFDDAGIVRLDEPTNHLDEEHRRLVRAALQRWLAHRTVVLISHDLELVRALADRIVWLDDGRIVAEGTPEELLT